MKPKQVNERLFEVGADYRVEEGLARDKNGRPKAGRVDQKTGEVLEAEEREWKVYQRVKLTDADREERGTNLEETWDLVRAGFATSDEAIAFVSKQ